MSYSGSSSESTPAAVALAQFHTTTAATKASAAGGQNQHNLPPLALVAGTTTLQPNHNASVLSTSASPRLQLDPLSMTKSQAMSQNADTALASSPRTARGNIVNDDERFAKMFSQKRAAPGFVAPFSKRLGNESLVHPPAVVVAPLVGENSREEKHERNMQRMFGDSSEARYRQYAGGLATYVRPSQSTVRCDTAASDVTTIPHKSSSRPPTTTPVVVLPQQRFVDLKQFEGAAEVGEWRAGTSSMRGAPAPTPPSTARQLESRNQFFFATRTPRAGGATGQGGLPQSLHDSFRKSTVPPTGKGAASPSRKPHTAGAVDTPTASDDDETADYVNQQTDQFDKKQRREANLKKNALLVTGAGEELASLSLTSLSTRTANHTSDLLKMIFHGRIALECETTHNLQEIADHKGTEGFIAEVSSAAQRTGFRTANVDEFHSFLCGFLRDPDASYSESRVIFQAIDANNSGVIDLPELLEGMRLLLLTESELILTYGRRLFTEPSKYKDARLSYLEVQAIFLSGLEFYECDISQATALTDPIKAEMLRSQRSVARKYNSNAKKHSSEDNNGRHGSPTDSNEGSQRAGANRNNHHAEAPPAMEKPSIEGIKRRMVQESTKVLQEAWKYSNGGLVAAPLLRTLMNGMGQTLLAAVSAIPHHFQLSRSTFLKDTLAKDSARYDSYLAQNNLDLDHMEARNAAQLGSRRGSRGKMKGRSAATPPSQLSTPPVLAPLMLPSSGSPSKGNGGAFALSSPRNSNIKHNATQKGSSSDNHHGGSSLMVVPISYEEYEEANGEVNVEALASQLRDPTLRLSQSQRATIAKQIVQSQKERGKSLAGPSAPNNNNNSSRRRSERSSLSKISIDGGDAASPQQQQQGGAGSSSSNTAPLKTKRQSMRKMQDWIPDLDEIVDAYHPRFQADLCRVGNLQRQLMAPEHIRTDYVSRQGHVFVKAGDERSFRPLTGEGRK